MRTKISEALHRRVNDLTLGDKARDAIRGRVRREEMAKAWHWRGIACAVACLLIGIFGVQRLRTPLPSHGSRHIKCVAVLYTDESRAEWSKRTVIVRKTNRTDSYVKVVACRPHATKVGGSTR
jgi:hypothetical protein